jgi:hypothetical protein
MIVTVFCGWFPPRQRQGVAHTPGPSSLEAPGRAQERDSLLGALMNNPPVEFNKVRLVVMGRYYCVMITGAVLLISCLSRSRS